MPMITFIWILFVSNLVGLALGQADSTKSTETRTTVISLKELPGLYSDDELPNPKRPKYPCFELCGCIDKPPLSALITDPFQMNTEFYVYNRNLSIKIPFERIENCLSSSNECKIYPFNLNLLIDSKLNPKLRTLIVSPGYMTRAPATWQHTIKDKWLDYEDLNVILVAWNGGNHGLYDFATVNSRLVARQLTVLLHYFAKLNSLSLNDTDFSGQIYMVGHSLGAHMSGFVGQDFGGNIARITGLDPAGPNFNSFEKKYKLDYTDAKLVEAIHTNGGLLSYSEHYFGTESTVGHLDFYANNGRTQPSCSADFLGCSHKLAPDYYIELLKHEIFINRYLKNVDTRIHRLFAFSSENYEDFHNGSALAKFCPITSLDDNDLYSEDIHSCSVPFSFFTPTGTYKNELLNEYHIDTYSKLDTPSIKFYFYTMSHSPYVNSHSLLKIRLRKKETSAEKVTSNTRGKAETCDIKFTLEMASGSEATHTLKSYKLMDDSDHYEMIVPYISPETISSFELAKLDMNDFYYNDHAKLKDKISKIFPFRISIAGFKKIVVNTGIVNRLKHFLGFGHSEQKEKSETCDIAIEKISVQPLKKLHRHLVALYSAAGINKALKIFVVDENEKSPKIDLLNEELDIMAESETQTMTIDSIILGPYNSKVDFKLIEEPEERPKEQSTIELSNGSNLSWLYFILGSIVFTSVFISLVSYIKIFYYASRKDDERILVDEIDL